MIAAFPRDGAWITLQLAARADDALVLLELAGRCPADPDARPTRATACTGPDDALARAARALADGWAAHAGGDRPPPAPVARAAVAHAVAGAPAPFCLFPNPDRGRPRAAHHGDRRA